MIRLKSILNEVVNANLLEECDSFKLYCDLDGVLVDFNKGISQLTGGLDFETYVKSRGYAALWKLVNSHGSIWWSTLPWTSDGKQLWNFIRNNNVIILTAGSVRNTGDIAVKGKKEWVHKNLGGNVPVIVSDSSKDKHKYSQKNHILIDDLETNINEWRSAGGIGILHKNTNDTINQLNAILKLK